MLNRVRIRLNRSFYSSSKTFARRDKISTTVKGQSFSFDAEAQVYHLKHPVQECEPEEIIALSTYIRRSFYYGEESDRRRAQRSFNNFLSQFPVVRSRTTNAYQKQLNDLKVDESGRKVYTAANQQRTIQYVEDGCDFSWITPEVAESIILLVRTFKSPHEDRIPVIAECYKILTENILLTISHADENAMDTALSNLIIVIRMTEKEKVQKAIWAIFQWLHARSAEFWNLTDIEEGAKNFTINNRLTLVSKAIKSVFMVLQHHSDLDLRPLLVYWEELIQNTTNLLRVRTPDSNPGGLEALCVLIDTMVCFLDSKGGGIDKDGEIILHRSRLIVPHEKNELNMITPSQVTFQDVVMSRFEILVQPLMQQIFPKISVMRTNQLVQFLQNSQFILEISSSNNAGGTKILTAAALVTLLSHTFDRFVSLSMVFTPKDLSIALPAVVSLVATLRNSFARSTGAARDELAASLVDLEIELSRALDYISYSFQVCAWSNVIVNNIIHSISRDFHISRRVPKVDETIIIVESLRMLGMHDLPESLLWCHGIMQNVNIKLTEDGTPFGVTGEFGTKLANLNFDEPLRSMLARLERLELLRQQAVRGSPDDFPIRLFSYKPETGKLVRMHDEYGLLQSIYTKNGFTASRPRRFNFSNLMQLSPGDEGYPDIIAIDNERSLLLNHRWFVSGTKNQTGLYSNTDDIFIILQNVQNSFYNDIGNGVRVLILTTCLIISILKPSGSVPPEDLFLAYYPQDFAELVKQKLKTSLVGIYDLCILSDAVHWLPKFKTENERIYTLLELTNICALAKQVVISAGSFEGSDMSICNFTRSPKMEATFLNLLESTIDVCSEILVKFHIPTLSAWAQQCEKVDNENVINTIRFRLHNTFTFNDELLLDLLSRSTLWPVNDNTDLIISTLLRQLEKRISSINSVMLEDTAMRLYPAPVTGFVNCVMTKTPLGAGFVKIIFDECIKRLDRFFASGEMLILSEIAFLRAVGTSVGYASGNELVLVPTRGTCEETMRFAEGVLLEKHLPISLRRAASSIPSFTRVTEEWDSFIRRLMWRNKASPLKLAEHVGRAEEGCTDIIEDADIGRAQQLQRFRETHHKLVITLFRQRVVREPTFQLADVCRILRVFGCRDKNDVFLGQHDRLRFRTTEALLTIMRENYSTIHGNTDCRGKTYLSTIFFDALAALHPVQFTQLFALQKEAILWMFEDITQSMLSANIRALTKLLARYQPNSVSIILRMVANSKTFTSSFALTDVISALHNARSIPNAFKHRIAVMKRLKSLLHFLPFCDLLIIDGASLTNASRQTVISMFERWISTLKAVDIRRFEDFTKWKAICWGGEEGIKIVMGEDIETIINTRYISTYWASIVSTPGTLQIGTIAKDWGMRVFISQVEIPAAVSFLLHMDDSDVSEEYRHIWMNKPGDLKDIELRHRFPLRTLEAKLHQVELNVYGNTPFSQDFFSCAADFSDPADIRTPYNAYGPNMPMLRISSQFCCAYTKLALNMLRVRHLRFIFGHPPTPLTIRTSNSKSVMLKSDITFSTFIEKNPPCKNLCGFSFSRLLLCVLRASFPGREEMFVVEDAAQACEGAKVWAKRSAELDDIVARRAVCKQNEDIEGVEKIKVEFQKWCEEAPTHETIVNNEMRMRWAQSEYEQRFMIQRFTDWADFEFFQHVNVLPHWRLAAGEEAEEVLVLFAQLRGVPAPPQPVLGTTENALEFSKEGRQLVSIDLAGLCLYLMYIGTPTAVRLLGVPSTDDLLQRLLDVWDVTPNAPSGIKNLGLHGINACFFGENLSGVTNQPWHGKLVDHVIAHLLNMSSEAVDSTIGTMDDIDIFLRVLTSLPLPQKRLHAFISRTIEKIGNMLPNASPVQITTVLNSLTANGVLKICDEALQNEIKQILARIPSYLLNDLNEYTGAQIETICTNLSKLGLLSVQAVVALVRKIGGDCAKDVDAWLPAGAFYSEVFAPSLWKIKNKLTQKLESIDAV